MAGMIRATVRRVCPPSASSVVLAISSVQLGFTVGFVEDSCRDFVSLRLGNVDAHIKKNAWHCQAV